MKRPVSKRFILVSAAILFTILLTLGLSYAFLHKAAMTNTGAAGVKLKELSTKEKLQDLNYLYDLLKENHPYFEVEKRKTGYDWLNHKKDFEKWVKGTKNNKEFYNAINKIVTLIQSGHTGIITPYLVKDYADLYSGAYNKAWSDVLNNEVVNKKNEDWSKTINNDMSILPVIFSYIEGAYVVAGHVDKQDYLEQYGIPLYSVLKKVDNVDIDEYIKDMMDRNILSYDYKRKKLKLSNLLINCDEGKSIDLTFQTPDGSTIQKKVAGIKYSLSNGSMKNSGSVYSTASEISGEKIAYLKISSFNAFNVNRDRDGIYGFLTSIKDYPYLIVDIRGNGGGSESYWIENVARCLVSETKEYTYYMAFRGGKYIKPFLESRSKSTAPISTFPEGLNTPRELKGLFDSFDKTVRSISPSKPVGFKGKIYLLVDGYVFSSAESFALFAKSTGWATIVGTWTGGDGIGFDPGLFSLPNSGLVIRFPLEMGLNPDGTSNEEYHTAPDIYAEQTYEDFIKHQQYQKVNNGIIDPYDTVLNKVLELIKGN